MADNYKDIVAQLDAINPETCNDDKAARYQIKEAARRLLNRMQTPWERAWEIAGDNPSVFAASTVVLDLGVFQGWAKVDGKEQSLDKLVSMCIKPCEPNLLRRMLRFLACWNVIEETGEDRWKTNEFSQALADAEGFAALTLKCGEHLIIGAGRNLPSYFAKTTYADYPEPGNDNFKDYDAEGLDFFARCGSDPKIQASFIDGIMTGVNEHKLDWTEVYDTKPLIDDYILKGESEVCMVDMGGGHGKDTTRLLAKHPELPEGSLCLQDLPDVVAMAKVNPKIKTMSHDIFTPQPIKGACFYYMHAVLHDWSDDETRRIFENLTPAMKKGYSKILLYENVLPPTGAQMLQASLDLCVLYVLQSAERSEATWRTLLDSCGLKVSKIWRHPLALECVIEIELK